MTAQVVITLASLDHQQKVRLMMVMMMMMMMVTSMRKKTWRMEMMVAIMPTIKQIYSYLLKLRPRHQKKSSDNN